MLIRTARGLKIYNALSFSRDKRFISVSERIERSVNLAKIFSFGNTEKAMLNAFKMDVSI